jgi:O-antigen/teichoic acid export membrane protein
MFFDLLKSSQDHLYRNSIAIMLNSGSTIIFGTLFWIVAARLTPIADVGLSTATIAIITLISTLSFLGMDIGLIRYLPKYENKNKLYSTIIIINILLSVIFSIIFLLLLNVISPKISFLLNIDASILLIICIIINSIYNIQNLALISLRKANLSAIQSILLIIRIPALFILLYLGVIGILLAYYIILIIPILIGAYFLHKNGVSFQLDLDISVIRNIFKFSFGNFTSSIFSIVSSNMIPILIINILGAEKNAYFFIANSIATAMLLIPYAISTSLLVEGSHNKPLRENVIKSIKFISILIIPAFLVIFIFGDQLILIFFKSYSPDAVELLKLLAISNIFASIVSIFQSIKKIQKDVKIMNIINILLSILMIVFGYIFLIQYGLIGIGYAWIISYLIMTIIVCIVITRNEKWIFRNTDQSDYEKS